MAKKEACCEKFKTMIGGQALLEGIMMRGPEKDAIVMRTPEGLKTVVKQRKLPGEKSVLRWPLIRGVYNFFNAQVTGVKATMDSVELLGEEPEEPSKFEKWLEDKLGGEKMQKLVVGLGVALGLGLSILLFFLLPMLVSGLLDKVIPNTLVLHLIEGVVRITIFLAYVLLTARIPEMKRVFAYHGAEHKTIRCYEAGLPLTVENVRTQTRLHPRCGTSFLLVVMILSILVFSVASSGLLALVPALELMRGSFLFRLIMIAYKLLLLPIVVAFSYEINRWVGRHDNWFTRFLTAPGMWMQKVTTNEPDDSMIEVGIASLQAVLPEQEGTDRW